MERAILYNNTLTYNGNEYDVRYTTKTAVVCNTDELFGKFGDEFPMKQVIDYNISDEPVMDIPYERDIDPYFN